MFTSRNEVLGMVASIPLQTIPYSQIPPRYDCSTHVARCHGAPDPLAWNTENMVTSGWFVPIATFDELPGDVWGLMGRGTLGDAGHTAVIVDIPANRADRRWLISEQTGPDGSPGPHLNTYSAVPDGYQVYRSIYIREVDDVTTVVLFKDETGQLWRMSGDMLWRERITPTAADHMRYWATNPAGPLLGQLFLVDLTGGNPVKLSDPDTASALGVDVATLAGAVPGAVAPHTHVPGPVTLP